MTWKRRRKRRKRRRGMSFENLTTTTTTIKSRRKTFVAIRETFRVQKPVTYFSVLPCIIVFIKLTNGRTADVNAFLVIQRSHAVLELNISSNNKIIVIQRSDCTFVIRSMLVLLPAFNDVVGEYFSSKCLQSFQGRI